MKNIILALSILLVLSCKNSTSSGSNVDIEWRGGQVFTYRYSSGVLVGGTWHNKFEVTDGSGDVTFKVYVNGSKKKTETVTVEEGLIYGISVSVSTGSCSYSNSSTAELKSSSANSPRKLKTDCSSMGIGNISVNESTN